MSTRYYQPAQDSIFSDELNRLDHRLVGNRQEILNTGERHAVDIGVNANETIRIAEGQRRTGSDRFDDALEFIQPLEEALEAYGGRRFSPRGHLEDPIARGTIEGRIQIQLWDLINLMNRQLSYLGEPPLTQEEEAQVRHKTREAMGDVGHPDISHRPRDSRIRETNPDFPSERFLDPIDDPNFSPPRSANERVAQVFDDVRAANARVDQAFSDAGRASPSPRSGPSRSTALTNLSAFTRPVESIRPAAAFPPTPSPSPSGDVMVDQYRQRALEMRGRSSTSQGAMRPTATDFEQVRRASVPAPRRGSPSPSSGPSRSTALTNRFSITRPVESIMPPASFPSTPSRTPPKDVMVDQYRQRALEMRGRSATSRGAIRPTATDFERVRRGSVPTAPRRQTTRPADRVSEVFERFSRPTATQAPLGPNGPGVTTDVLGDPLGVTGGSFFSSPLMGPSVGPFRPARATSPTGGSFFSSPLMGPFRPVTVAPAPSRLVRPSVAPVRTRPTKTRATQTRTTPAPWERQSGVDGGVAYGGKQPSTPNARSRNSSGQSMGGSILDSIFGNPTNPWERQHGSRVYGGRDQPTSPNARSKSSRGSKGAGSGGGGGGCFITTAICQAANLSDDCHELTTLRRFRDEVMRPDPAMKADIEHYYEVAPRIVAGVEATGRADAIWADTRAHYLDPAIRHIEAGNHDLAHAVYRRMVKDLSVFGDGA